MLAKARDFIAIESNISSDLKPRTCDELKPKVSPLNPKCPKKRSKYEGVKA